MLNDLFEVLADPDFQAPGSGLMTFPAYVYVYPPDREYEFRRALTNLQERLTRPKVQVQPSVCNIYEALLDFLRDKTLGGRSLLDRIMEVEAEKPDMIDRQLKQHARSDPFAEYMAGRFDRFVHEEDSALDRPYVFLHGWGAIHPYLRASQFLDRMEQHVRGYKLILFYPGTYESGEFRLFGRLESSRVYRASCLNELVGT